MKNKIANRQEYNIKIIEAISEIITEYPQLRFGQILSILRCDGDMFNEEPEDTYKKIENYRKNYQI
jgi:hypothetical protein